MKLTASVGKWSDRDGCAVEFYFEDQKDKPTRNFAGKIGDRMFFADPAGRGRIAMRVGLGLQNKFDRDVLRKAASEAARELVARGVSFASFDLSSWPGQDAMESAVVAAESVRLGQYRFVRKSDPPKEKFLQTFTILCRSAAERKKISADLEFVSAVADGVDLARDISNLPGNLGPPAEIARIGASGAPSADVSDIGRIAKTAAGSASPTPQVPISLRSAGQGVRASVLDRRACERLGMGAFLAVARGSHQPPAFLVLEYRPVGGFAATDRKPIALVGKGVTFDSGGISIKPADKMEEMKHDKSGAAAVIGIFAVARKLKPHVPLVGICPLTENLPGGGAARPGDVVRSLSGKTIEIKNTDAEGRLILADALYYAGRFKPQAIIDIATLTGAASIALGDVYSAILSNSDALTAALCRAGETSGERLWRLPLHDDYERLIKSSVADVQNIPEGRLAGTVIGGMFLKKFLANDLTPWAHIDIAATAWDAKGRDGKPAGSTGVGVRLFYEFLKTRGDLP